MKISVYIDQCQKNERKAFYAACINKHCGMPYTLAKEPKGKPYLVDCALSISITHKADTVVVAFSENKALGIDIEMLHPYPKALSIARRFFNEHEHDALAMLADMQQSELFFAMWTAKEALLKREGMVVPKDLHLAHLNPETLQPEKLDACIKHIRQGNALIAIAGELVTEIEVNGVSVAAIDYTDKSIIA